MFSGIFLRLLICLTVFSVSIYSYLDKQNICTELKMHLPKVTKEIAAIREVNANLKYQIECFENPQHLLSLASNPEYAHLKFPVTEEVLTVKEGLAVQWDTPQKGEKQGSKSKTPIVAKQ